MFLKKKKGNTPYIPDELLVEIFLFLSLPKRLRLTIICKRFQGIIKSEYMWREAMKEILCFERRMDFNAIVFLRKQAKYVSLTSRVAGQTTYNVPSLQTKWQPDGNMLPWTIFLEDILNGHHIMLETTGKKEFERGLKKWLKNLSLQALEEACVVLGKMLKEYDLFTGIDCTNVNSSQGLMSLAGFRSSSRPLFPKKLKEAKLRLEKLFFLFLKKHPNVIFRVTSRVTSKNSFSMLEKKIQEFERIIKERELPIKHLTLKLTGMPNLKNATDLFKVFSHSNLKLSSLSLLCKGPSGFDRFHKSRDLVCYKYAKNFGSKVAGLLENNKATLKSIEFQLCFKSLQQYKNLFAGIKKCERVRKLSFAFCLDPIYANHPNLSKQNTSANPVFKELWGLLDNLKRLSKLKIIFEGQANMRANWCFMKYAVTEKKCFNIRKLYYDFLWLIWLNNDVDRPSIYYDKGFLDLLDKHSKVEKLFVFEKCKTNCRHQMGFNISSSFPLFFSSLSKRKYSIKNGSNGRRFKVVSYPSSESPVILYHDAPKVDFFEPDTYAALSPKLQNDR